MKILVLMPLDERQVFHAMGLYAALDSATKAKCINMPGFMDWTILVGKAKNWEDALLKAIITADKAIRQKEQEDIIVFGNVPVDAAKFDLVVSYKDGADSSSYQDKFLEMMREKAAQEPQLANLTQKMYTADDAKLNMVNRQATGDFLSQYIKTGVETDDQLRQQYQNRIKSFRARR